LPASLLPYAGVFGQALLEMGTDKEDYVKLSQRIGRTTGGIGSDTLITPVVASAVGDQPTAAYLMLRGKSTPEQAPEMLDILRDVLLTAQLDNRERFRQIVLEAKAGAESGLAPGGHIVTNTRLRAHLHPAYRIEEAVNGVENLLFLRRLAERIDGDWPGVLADLEATRAALVSRGGLIANVTLDEARYGQFAPRLAEFIDALPKQSVRIEGGPNDLATLPRYEGLAFPAQVNYVGKGGRLYDLGYELDGSIAVINNLLRTGYLLQKIRIQGGAYGAFCTFSATSGIYTYLSYRDPNVSNTLAVYDATADFLRGLELSEDELTRGIIGAIGSIDAYQLPDAKGYTSLTRYLTGETDERLQRFRDQALGTTTADFRKLADALEALKTSGDVVVLGSREALDGAAIDLAMTRVM
ncbi:MAG TPA: peptidase M16, partial [Promineifilum sp.]|nr:peptidase M16 [Promineifilum sp.]